MTVQSPFQPARKSGQKVTATTSNQVVTIGKGSKSLRAVNFGAVPAYFVTYAAGADVQTADSTQTALGPSTSTGSAVVIEKPQDHDTVAYSSDSATAVMHFQAGEGGS